MTKEKLGVTRHDVSRADDTTSVSSLTVLAATAAPRIFPRSFAEGYGGVRHARSATTSIRLRNRTSPMLRRAARSGVQSLGIVCSSRAVAEPYSNGADGGNASESGLSPAWVRIRDILGESPSRGATNGGVANPA